MNRSIVLFSALFAVARAAAGDDDAQITFTTTDTNGEPTLLWRVQAVPGAALQPVTPQLDTLALFPGSDVGPITVSSDGFWYVFYSERFDAQSAGYPGLTLARSDFTSVETVHVSGQTLHGEGGQAAVVAGGNAIVYTDSGGPHTTDLFLVTRDQGTNWQSPILLTAASTYDLHVSPVISPDGSKVAFEMSLNSDPYTGVAIGEVKLNATGFHVLVTKTNFPPAQWPSQEAHVPAYAPDGILVFEADWSQENGNDERIWRLPVGGQATLITTAFGDDNSPAVLPDGRIVSLWLESPASPSLHEIKVMNADGADYYMATSQATLPGEIDDIGMGAGLMWAPILAARATAGGVQISWPARFTNFVLQT